MVSGEIFARGIHFRIKAERGFSSKPSEHLRYRDMAEMATLNGSPTSRWPLVLVPGDRSLPPADQSERWLLFSTYLQAVGQAGSGSHHNT